MTPCLLCGAPASKHHIPLQQSHCTRRFCPWLKCLVCKQLFRPITKESR